MDPKEFVELAEQLVVTRMAGAVHSAQRLDARTMVRSILDLRFSTSWAFRRPKMLKATTRR
jgi:hypothetical protein